MNDRELPPDETGNGHRPLARHHEFVVRELAGETLIYNVSTDRCSCVEGSAAVVWALCDGTRSVEQIGAQAGLDGVEGRKVLEIVLEELRSNSLLVEASVPITEYRGLSRREMLKRAGIMAAVPLVSALLVPTAAAAASVCIPLGAPCTVGSTPCCSGTCFNTETGPTGFTCVPPV